MTCSRLVVLVIGRWFSPGPPVSSINKTDRHDITEILLKVALNTIKQIHKHTFMDRVRDVVCSLTDRFRQDISLFMDSVRQIVCSLISRFRQVVVDGYA